MNYSLLWKLYLIFFKIGGITFGGGYAMIPLFYSELIEQNNFLLPEQFGDIVAIAQFTPGPISINAATYIGYLQNGPAGALACTMGILTPSLIIISIIAHYSEKFKDSHLVQGALRGIRPVMIGLIASAVLYFAEMSIFSKKIPFSAMIAKISQFKLPSFEVSICYQALLIFLLAIVAVKKFKISVILVIMSSAILGISLMQI